MAKVLGVLGGRDTPLARLATWASAAELVVAADSGADLCLAAGIRPVVVGDMDSFKGRSAGLTMVEDSDQETTDCDKLLAWVHAQGHPSLAVACLEGDRLDHMLASLSSLSRSPLKVGLVLRRGVGRVVRAGETLEIEVPAGTRLSLIGIGPGVASLEGVRWPLEDAQIGHPEPGSVSNRAEGNARASVRAGVAILTVEWEGGPWAFPWHFE